MRLRRRGRSALIEVKGEALRRRWKRGEQRGFLWLQPFLPKRFGSRIGFAQLGSGIALVDNRFGRLAIGLKYGDRALMPLVIGQQDKRRGRASSEQQDEGS